MPDSNRLNLYPNKKLFGDAKSGGGIPGARHLRNRHEEAMAMRQHYNAGERQKFGNEAALLPDDAWRDVDETTMRVLREDEGQAYMADLIPLARAVDIGKTAHVYRRSTDIQNRVNVTMNGQTPTLLDKVDYTFEGHPVPIFDTGYGLNWREYRGMQSEGFDGISDDQEAAVSNIEQVSAQYVLNGDQGIRVNQYEGFGITTHPATNDINLSNTDSGGINIDLTSFTTTSDNIEVFFARDFQRVLHDNLVKDPVTIYVSPEIERRFSRSYTGQTGFKSGTLKEFLETMPFIAAIKMTYELTGNHFVAFPLKSQYIRPLIGQAITTIAIPRLTMTDDYNFKVFKALGIEIREDANGRCGVINAQNNP